MSTSRVPEPHVVDVRGVTTAVVAAVIDMSEIRGFFDHAFSKLPRVILGQGAAVVGPAFARYHGPPGDTVDLELGFPTDVAVRTEAGVHAGSLPGGRVARTVHHGGFEDLGGSWERIRSWIADQGLAPGPDLWEVYLTRPTPDMDPADLRTELNWSLAPPPIRRT